MDGYMKLSDDFGALARKLGQIEQDRQERSRRIAERREEARLEAAHLRREGMVQKALWWVSPASWAAVFVVGFFITDWIFDRLDFFLSALGL
jgi:hypothetical protein